MCCLEEDDFYDEDFEEKPSKSKKPKISSFDALKKHFDVVEVVRDVVILCAEQPQSICLWPRVLLDAAIQSDHQVRSGALILYILQ